MAREQNQMPDRLYVAAIETLARWVDEARSAGEVEPTAMTLATVSANGDVAARVVLMKALDERGVVFYTNLDSVKGQHLRAHPRCAACFYFSRLERQVRVEGVVTQVDPDESDAYFASRHRGSQIGAWASAQSRPLQSREQLEEKVAQLEARYDGIPVPRPPHWGGLRITPVAIELWQGMASRLHERWRYEQGVDGWTRTLLSP